MYTIMHLADIHRSEYDPISNSELISCLVSDVERYGAERPPLSLPDAIVIAGDLVQGLPLGSSHYPAELEHQYQEALDLLARLADSFLGGDRTRILIAPGNHDVDWNLTRSSMEEANLEDQDLDTLLSVRGSPYRWSMKNRQLYRIAPVRTGRR